MVACGQRGVGPASAPANAASAPVPGCSGVGRRTPRPGGSGGRRAATGGFRQGKLPTFLPTRGTLPTMQCASFTGPAPLLPACPAACLPTCLACRKQLPVQRMLDFDFLCGGCCWAEPLTGMRFYRADCGGQPAIMQCVSNPSGNTANQRCPPPACRPQDAVSGGDRAARRTRRLPEAVFWQGGDCHPAGRSQALKGHAYACCARHCAAAAVHVCTCCCQQAFSHLPLQ